MSDSVISIKNLGKKYIIRHSEGKVKQPGYSTLREVLHGRASLYTSKMLNSLRFWEKRKSQDAYLAPPKCEEFWALSDVSFSVEKGEKIGIIGRNGAGKTTLLKLLSRITEPTTGSIRFRGRTGTLLEVGTGFHPELTGRENIYLNGIILGMKRSEIKTKFDEIVAFAEVEQFLDTPVKRYSSGMYVRLAFSVAAHLDAEILLIDEVLAVGDAAFQKKSINKMKSMSSDGRTILFVSHQLGHISSFCQRSILLENGKIIHDAPTENVIHTYTSKLKELGAVSLRMRNDRVGDGKIRAVDTWIENEKEERINHVFSGMNINICVQYEKLTSLSLNDIEFVFPIWHEQGILVTSLSNISRGQDVLINSLSGIIKCMIPKFPLNSGFYYYNILMRSRHSRLQFYDVVQNANSFTVEQSDYFNSGRMSEKSALILLEQTWIHEQNISNNC